MLSIKTIGAAAVGAAAIGLSIGSVAPAGAATLTYDFTVNVTTGPVSPNQFTGFFSFDDTGLIGVGPESFGIANGLQFAFDYLGTTYTELDDFLFPNYPIVDFLDGDLVGLSFAAANGGGEFGIGNASSGFFDGGSDFAYGSNIGNPSTFDGVGQVSYTLRGTPIPTPALLPGLIGMGIAAMRKKRQSEQSEQVAETAEV